MTTIEDRLRAAASAAAKTVPPGSAPPLRLPVRHRRYLRWSGQGRTAGWQRLAAPLAAAAAVAAVAAASLAVASETAGRRPDARTSAPTSAGAIVPPYYVSLPAAAGTPWASTAQVRVTATGAVAATVAVPRPYRLFTAVAGADDGRTFVLEAQSQGNYAPAGFYLLRVVPGAGTATARLSALPIPPEPRRIYVESIALSPDGSKLAVAVRAAGGGPVRNPGIQVITVATGASKRWTWPGGGHVSTNGLGQALSWAADDKTLAFQAWMSGSIDIRLLDTAAPGHTLAASKVILRFPSDGNLKFIHGKIINSLDGFNALITPDGSKIVCATLSETRTGGSGLRAEAGDLAFTEFSARTGRVVRTLGNWRIRGFPVQVQDVLWTSRSGSKLIVVDHQPGAHPSAPSGRVTYRLVIGTLTSRSFAPLATGAELDGGGTYPVW
jgi:hypothetical protein